MYKQDYVKLKYGGGKPNSVIREYKTSDITYYLCSINPEQPTDIVCFMFRGGKVMTIKEYMYIQIEPILMIHLYNICLNVRLYNSFFHLYYPCFSINTADTECLNTDMPMYFHFHIKPYEPKIPPCECDNSAWFPFYNILNTSPNDIIEDKRIIQYEPNIINLIRIYNKIYNYNLLIFDFNMPVNAGNNNNNLCHLASFIMEANPKYTITNNNIYMFLGETLNLWINFQKISLNNTSSFGSFRGEAIPWLHYKQKDKQYFKEVFKMTPIDYYNNFVKIFLEPQIPQSTDTKEDVLMGGGFAEPYDQLKYNVTQEFIKYNINLPLANNMFDNFYNGLLDGISFGVLYKKHIQHYETLLEIYNKHTYKNHDEEYKTALKFINALLQHKYDINMIVKIKNFAHNGVFGVEHYNMLKTTFTNTDKKIINAYVKQYYPLCKM